MIVQAGLREPPKSHERRAQVVYPLEKKIQLRSELIDQMSKWHSLLQAGGISQDDYDELHKDIKEY